MEIVPTYQATPLDDLDYGEDWGKKFLQGDTITTSTWDLRSELTSHDDGHDDTQTVIWLTGGVAGTTYLVSNTITTADGREATRSFWLSITEPL